MQCEAWNDWCPISNFALVGVLIYVETSFPDLGILDNPILTAIVLVAVFVGILITWISTHLLRNDS
jgi:hypothetical protein